MPKFTRMKQQIAGQAKADLREDGVNTMRGGRLFQIRIFAFIGDDTDRFLVGERVAKSDQPRIR